MDKNTRRVIASLYGAIMEMWNNGGLDSERIQELIDRNPGHEETISEFIKLHTANTLERVRREVKEHGVAQVELEARFCEFDEKLSKTLAYVVKLDNQRGQCEDDVTKLQAKRDAEFARLQDERDSEFARLQAERDYNFKVLGIVAGLITAIGTAIINVI